MKYNVVFKFLAVALCALMLLGAVGSAAGILVMTEGGLYDRTVSEVRQERIESDARGLASLIAENYADVEYGGYPEELMENDALDFWSGWFYGSFDPELSHYTLTDAEGNVVETGGTEGLRGSQVFSFSVSDPYRHVISIAPAQETEIVIGNEEDSVENHIPDGGAEVYGISFTYDGGSESMGSVDAFGYIEDYGTYVRFWSYGALAIPGGALTSLTFRDGDDNVLYGRTGSNIGGFIQYEDETLVYDSSLAFTGSAGALVDAVPPEGADVYSFSLKYDSSVDGGSGISSADPVGVLSYDDDGNLLFQASVKWAEIPSDAVFHYAEFRDKEGNMLYRTTDEFTGIHMTNPEGGLLAIRFTPLAEDTPELETFRETTDATEVTIPATVPQITDGSLGVAQTGLNIYSLPSVNSETAGRLEAGTEVEIIVRETVEGVDWGQIDGGWIMLEHVTPVTAPAAAAALLSEATVPEETAAAETVTETTVPEATVPETVPEEASTQPEEPATDVAFISDKVYTDTYWDEDTQQNMEVCYRYAAMPEMTVELRVAPGGFRYDAEFELLEIVWNYRNDLFWVLGVSLLLFAVLAVYLCCAAGKKPGSVEIHAGGFNCIPLDAYLAGGGALIFGLMALVANYADNLVSQNITLAAACVAGAGYFMCLIFVGFCFACAAQFKTPGGYWWRNSLFFRCIDLLVKLIHGFFKFCVWLARKLPAVFRLLKGCVLAVLRLIQRPQVWLWEKIRGAFRRLGKWIRHYYGLLPMIWQWVLVGFIMVLTLFVALASGSGLAVVLSLCACVAAVLYGAYCFGILLESAGRMSKGDLDTKVEEKYLVGSFGDFAENLNDLADVAVVAAQKQLKSERMKTELITNVSHDIKTPLTSIINYVDLLQKPHTPQEEKTYLEVLDRQSQRLKKLIDDLMEMSKASTGNLTVDITRLDAAEAVNQALGEFADKLEKARLTPVFRRPEQSIAMMADGRLVWRVLSNLLCNAVKYALSGTRLYIDLVELEGKVIISLKNISREELNVEADELMERFVRGDDSRNTEGSGLGLNIAKTLMELQKGQLQLLVDGDLFKVTLIFPGADEN